MGRYRFGGDAISPLRKYSKVMPACFWAVFRPQARGSLTPIVQLRSCSDLGRSTARARTRFPTGTIVRRICFFSQILNLLTRHSRKVGPDVGKAHRGNAILVLVRSGHEPDDVVEVSRTLLDNAFETFRIFDGKARAIKSTGYILDKLLDELNVSLKRWYPLD